MSKTQTEIPGAERPSIPQLDNAAREYVEARDERMRLTREEVKTKETLLRHMQEFEAKLETNADGDLCYVFGDGDQELMCVLRTSEKLAVKKLSTVHEGVEDAIDAELEAE